ncbi:hypothetical protein N7492_000737 [Penicillium capsulatum]|uniref:Lysine-specific metallo-endopeptidase domain-containing protein n=1 Tax=Penicillium capsulatum TaxID=69766 RepID=A0A9W9IWH2_9EURO|nr:hypothetical protein N7492_000737 [Penicillium capsulatum]KAJ6130204.1 hypothetical protein N7512_002984 [Penicillium capsulatum]
MLAQFRSVVLLIVLPAILLPAVRGLGIPKRDDSQFVMNPNAVHWDKSCDELSTKYPRPETKKQVVEQAWSGALRLIDSAWNRFDKKTYPILKRGEFKALDADTQDRVNDIDPATGLRKSGRSCLLATRTNVDPNTNGRPDTKIEISCPATLVIDDQDLCANTVARTIGSRLHFCPQFFKQPRFSDFLAQLKKENPSWIERWYNSEDYFGTDAQAIVHELSHIPWLGAANFIEGELQEEVYGLVEANAAAWNDGAPIANNKRVNINGDTYGWYAEFGYCQEQIPNLWPSWEEKKVVLPIEYDGEEC